MVVVIAIAKHFSRGGGGCGVFVLNETQGCSPKFIIVLLYNIHLHCVHIEM